MKICIVLLNYNGKNDTLECIASLKKLNHNNYEILLVDNGSSDNSLSEIKAKHSDILFLDNIKNLGFAEGNNRGIAFALEKYEALLILNNDTIVDKDLLRSFEDFSQENPKSVLGAKIYQYYNRDLFDHIGGIWNPRKAKFDLVGAGFKEDHKSFETPISLDYICGCALFAKTEAFKNIGLFDPRFFLFWEESDFCKRAQANGFDVQLCPSAKLWHKVSASFTGGKPHTTYFWWRNRLLWMEKNLSRPDFFLSFLRILTPEIFKLLRHRVLKYFQLLFINKKKNPQSFQKKTDFLLINKAALCGIKDYFSRSFFEGPSWIFKKKS